MGPRGTFLSSLAVRRKDARKGWGMKYIREEVRTRKYKTYIYIYTYVYIQYIAEKRSRRGIIKQIYVYINMYIHNTEVGACAFPDPPFVLRVEKWTRNYKTNPSICL